MCELINNIVIIRLSTAATSIKGYHQIQNNVIEQLTPLIQSEVTKILHSFIKNLVSLTKCSEIWIISLEVSFYY